MQNVTKVVQTRLADFLLICVYFFKDSLSNLLTCFTPAIISTVFVEVERLAEF